MREPRVRSELIAALSMGGGGGALRSCTLRASSAETATGPTGTNPLNAAADLLTFSVCLRSSRRFGGTRRTCGSTCGGGAGAATTVRLCKLVVGGAGAGCLGSFPGAFFFAFLVLLDSASAATRKSRARSRRLKSESTWAMISIRVGMLNHSTVLQTFVPILCPVGIAAHPLFPPDRETALAGQHPGIVRRGVVERTFEPALVSPIVKWRASPTIS
jgi:hypothetical protein